MTTHVPHSSSQQTASLSITCVYEWVCNKVHMWMCGCVHAHVSMCAFRWKITHLVPRNKWEKKNSFLPLFMWVSINFNLLAGPLYRFLGCCFQDWVWLLTRRFQVYPSWNRCHRHSLGQLESLFTWCSVIPLVHTVANPMACGFLFKLSLLSFVYMSSFVLLLSHYFCLESPLKLHLQILFGNGDCVL